MKIISSFFWVFLLVTLMPMAGADAEAQSTNPCNDPNNLPPSFFQVPVGPQGNWTAVVSPDQQQADDPLIPVVVSGAGSIQGPSNLRGLRLGCGVLKNRSQNSVTAVLLRWVLVRNQDRRKIIHNGYTSDTVLVEGYTPPIELTIPKESVRSIDFSLINFASVTQGLTKDGMLSGDYFLYVGVHQILFEDRSVWKSKPLF